MSNDTPIAVLVDSEGNEVSVVEGADGLFRIAGESDAVIKTADGYTLRSVEKFSEVPGSAMAPTALGVTRDENANRLLQQITEQNAAIIALLQDIVSG